MGWWCRVGVGLGVGVVVCWVGEGCMNIATALGQLFISACFYVAALEVVWLDYMQLEGDYFVYGCPFCFV